MNSMSKQVLGLLALLSAIAPLPGGAVLAAYSIEYNFFPYFLSVVPVAKLAFISLVAAFVYLMALGFGMIAMSSAFMIGAVFVRFCYLAHNGVRKRSALLTAIRTLSGNSGHLLLPVSRHGLIGLFVVSFLILALFLPFAISLTLHATTRGSGLLLIYFLAVGLLSLILIDSAISWMEVVYKRLSFLALMLLATLSPFSATASLLNVWMTFMRFHSTPSQAVLVDDAAEEQIAQQAMFMPNDIKRCSINLPGRSMWYIPQGTVVWKDVGNKTLVSLGVTNTLPLQLNPDQVLLVSRSSALPC